MALNKKSFTVLLSLLVLVSANPEAEPSAQPSAEAEVDLTHKI